jgi:hypothetical protein
MLSESNASIHPEKTRIRCPACQRRFNVKVSLLGKSGPCPRCGQRFTITPAVLDPGPEPLEPGLEGGAVSGGGSTSPNAELPSRPAVAPTREPVVFFASVGHQYCFGLPTSGWLRLQPDDEKKITADLAVGHPHIGFVKVAVSDWPMSLEDFQQGLESSLGSEIKGFRIQNKGPAHVAGLPALFMEYSGRVAGGRLKYKAYVFVRNRMAYQIVGFSEPMMFPRLKKELATAVKSFSLEPAQVAQALEIQSAELAGPQAPPAPEPLQEAVPPPAPCPVLKIGRQRSPAFLNSIASVAHDLRQHIGRPIGGLPIIEWCGRWWLPLMIGGMILSIFLGRGKHALVALVLFFSSFLMPVAVYQWLPSALRKAFRRHLRKEIGGYVPDPDIAADDPLDRLGTRALPQIQEALNRHWAFHERQAGQQGMEYERIRGSGPLRDVLLPLVVAGLIGWVAWMISRGI